MKLKSSTRIVLLIFTFVMLFSLVSAQEYYQLNTNSKLFFTCTLNSAVPSTATTYNITMTSPDGTRWNCGVTNGGSFLCS